MKTPPPRLLDDPNALPELRDDLRRAAGAEYPYDSAAGLASLQAALLVTPAATAGGTGVAAHGGGAAASTTATGLGATKIAIATLATAISLGTVATIAWPKHPSGDGPAKTAVHDQQAAAAAAPVAAPAPAPVTAPVPEPAVADPAAEAAAAMPQRTMPADPDGRLRREIAQLAKIKALLPAQPKAALQLAQAGNREFARGMLVQEREGIAVLALAQLGRRREASTRARAFLTRFPDSPLRERIALIADGSAGSAQ